MSTKRERRLAAAARARKALGLDDENQVATSDSPGARGSVRGDESGRPRPDPKGIKRVLAKLAAGDPIGGRAAPDDVSRRVEPVRDQRDANAAARDAGLAFITDAAGTVHERHWPKKHAHAALKRGDSVWYRGERFWIEFAPDHWSKGCAVRITEHAIHPNNPSGTDLAYIDAKGEGHGCPWRSFCVHADLLALAPVAKSMYADQPTLAGIARAERAKKGEHDVGDEVAVKFRGAKTIDAMYKVGAEYLGVPVRDLQAKYGHLNHGQQRMNVGNRMRAKWKKSQRV